MTEELMQLLTALQQQYNISEEDIKAVAQAIDITIQEATGAVAYEAEAVGEEMAGQYEGEDY